MRSCKEWEEPLALAAGGDLATDERAAVDRHVADCPACAAMLAGLEQTLGALRDAHTEPMADTHFAAVRARVLTQIDSRPRRRWLWAAVVATAALLLALFWPKPAPVPPPPLVAVVPQCGRACFSLPVLPEAHAVRPRPRRHIHRAILPTEPLESAFTEPITVKLLTDDPNVVIYWLGDPK